MMHCNKCNSDWNTNKPVSVCPFCGASLADEGEPNVYDNSKDALAYIMRVHGADVLLGSTLKNYFADYAPGIGGARKHVIVSMSASGAAAVLQRKIAASAVEQENAFRQAVQKVVDAYGTERSLVENIVFEFTDALGWKINVQTQKQRETSQNQPVPPKPLKDRQESPKRPQDQQTLQANSNSPKLTNIPIPSELIKKEPTKVIIPSELIRKQPYNSTKPITIKTEKHLTVGQRNFKFGKYNWRVLDVQNGKALLLTEDIIEERCYNSLPEKITWEECELRRYLNGAFLQTFSSSEQSRIASVTNTNPDNPWYGTPGGKNTTDKVFLLSIDEVVKYFGDSGQLRKKPKDKFWIDDQYNEARMAKYGSNKAWWWLPSPGYYAYYAAFVSSDGCLGIHGLRVGNGLVGVRPALWLNL